MRIIECPTEKARENEINFFKKHGGRGKVLVQQGSELVTDEGNNNPGGELVASSDNEGVVTVH